MRDVRFVVIHRPGPQWQPGLPISAQAGVQDHVAHYRNLLEAGQLDFGGPFLDEAAGGMMVPVAGLSEEEIRVIAMSDPSVQAGLLTVEVRPWLIGMQRTPAPG